MRKAALLCALIAFLLLPLIALTAYAHPGRTDSRGGHKNHSTGEYHYHHGYSAHDHYDMDGDGDKDCPYDFRDKTDRSFRNGSRVASDTPKNNAKPSKTLWDIISTIFEHLWIGIFTWLSCSYFLSYFFFLIFGEEQGCSISMIVGAVISIGVTIWLIISKLS